MTTKEFKARTTERERYGIDLDYISKFAKIMGSDELSKNQLRSLWTSFCLRYDLEPDTGFYDYLAGGIYNKYVYNKFDSFGEYDLFMGEYLC